MVLPLGPATLKREAGPVMGPKGGRTMDMVVSGLVISLTIVLAFLLLHAAGVPQIQL